MGVGSTEREVRGTELEGIEVERIVEVAAVADAGKEVERQELEEGSEAEDESSVA